MSVEALIARLAPAEFDDLRAVPEIAPDRLWDLDEARLLDLELYWNPLGVMMREAEFPINPMYDGAPFPTSPPSTSTAAESTESWCGSTPRPPTRANAPSTGRPDEPESGQERGRQE